jgi:NAD(P)-dependent dehydrogenase (short-subunit alcohol dehydrogenase family)
MSGKLEGKVAVVTGGNSGIGLAIAQKFVAEGAYVFITGRRAAELDKAKAAIGNNVTAVPGDVAKLDDLDTLYDTVKREKGHLDIVVANAGVVGQTITGKTAPEEFDRLFNINARGAFFTVQKAVPLLKDGGAIVAVASNAQYVGFPGFAVYSATKAALRSFVRTWAAEFKDRGIRVNTLSPGPIDTPILETTTLDPAAIEAMKQQVVSLVPLGRMGRPEEMATAALFLASSDSSFITGIDLIADGGMTQF